MELTIKAQPRTILGKQNQKLRRQGKLPAVLYGKGKGSQSLEIETKEFETIYQQAGESTLVNLVIGGKKERKVLIHEVARHYMKDEPIHVDFYEVDLKRKIHAKIPLHFIGVSQAVKELGGILVKTLNEVEVEALPGDLPPFIEVDISTLKTFEDFVRVNELRVAPGIKILTGSDEIIVSVQPPRSEKELAELEKPVAEVEKEAIAEIAEEAVEEKEKEEGGEEETKVSEPVEAEKKEKTEEKK